MDIYLHNLYINPEVYGAYLLNEVCRIDMKNKVEYGYIVHIQPVGQKENLIEVSVGFFLIDKHADNIAIWDNIAEKQLCLIK